MALPSSCNPRLLVKKEIQTSFAQLDLRGPTTHGGELSVGRRKKQRPISIKKSIHVVMMSSRAKGLYSLRAIHNKGKVEELIWRYAKRFHIKIYKFAINFNHIHFVLKAKRRDDLQNFLRTTAGLIACLILKAKKGVKKGKFWNLLAFSRIIEWGKAFQIVMSYVLQNELEACVEIPYKPRRVKSKRKPP